MKNSNQWSRKQGHDRENQQSQQLLTREHNKTDKFQQENGGKQRQPELLISVTKEGALL